MFILDCIKSKKYRIVRFIYELQMVNYVKLDWSVIRDGVL